MLTQLINALQNLGNRNKQKLISSANSPLHILHEANWPEPKKLEIGTLNVPELRREMLPKLVSDYVFEQANLRDNADPEYAAIAVLTSAAALIGGSVTISPKDLYKDWKLKPVLWAMNIGSPSRMKTPSLLIGINLIKYATKQVIVPSNQQLEKEFNASQRSNKAKISKLEKDAEKYVQDGNDKAAKKIYLEIEELTLPQPKYRKPFVNDATIEALIKRIESNPLGLLLYRDELYGWISGLESKEKAQERSFCNEAFNGFGVYEVERVLRGNLVIENPTLFVMGNIQPDRLKILISGREKGQSNDGLFERFQLMVYPDGRKKSYVDATTDDSLKLRMQEVFIKLAYLGKPERYSTPLNFNFEVQAQALWDDWAARLIERESDSDNDEQAILGKYGALVAKLALVFHLLVEAETCEAFHDFNPDTKVTINALKLAIEWSEFLFLHNVKIRSIGSKNASVFESAENLKSRLSSLPYDFSYRDLQRKCWTGLKSQDEINEAIEVLTIHGYIRKHSSKGVNGRVTARYIVHPSYRSM